MASGKRSAFRVAWKLNLIEGPTRVSATCTSACTASIALWTDDASPAEAGAAYGDRVVSLAILQKLAVCDLALADWPKRLRPPQISEG